MSFAKAAPRRPRLSAASTAALLATLPALAMFAACSPEPAAPGEASRPAAVRLDEAAHDAELGRDKSRSRATLEALRLDASLPAAAREDATLTLADLLDAENDRAGAATVLEDFLADQQSRGGDHSSERAQKRLRELVGLPEAPRRDVPSELGMGKLAPVTRALAAYFPADANKRVQVQSLIIGGSRDVDTRLGTWNLAAAIEARAVEACSLCDLPSVRFRSSRDASFLGLVRERELAKTALVVVYYDREEGLVPARYESFLALPLADLNARLDRGEGVIAVKSREGAPPLVLLAAPRRSQLATVDTSFAALTVLPDAPVSVSVSPALSAGEIQSVVRGAKGAFKACYETLLARSPQAAGRIGLDFGIAPTGTVENAKATATGTVDDAETVACFVEATRRLRFPMTSTKGLTTVRYPLDLAP